MVQAEAKLPVFATVARAYRLLWRHRALHAKAIWPPVVFLAAAEFVYHQVVGNAHGVDDRVHAALAAPWWSLAAAVLWLAGLKFLLSFSISWRRHLLLGERFDPFFFKAPFWRYLGFLLLTYAWIVVAAVVVLAATAVVTLGLHAARMPVLSGLALPAVAVLAGAWAIARQVPFFTALTLDPPRPSWRVCTRAMRGTAWRYLAAFVLAAIPVLAANAILDAGLALAHANRHAVPVALGESAFRQAMLFVHFSLGASIGAVTSVTALGRGALGLAEGRLLLDDAG